MKPYQPIYFDHNQERLPNAYPLNLKTVREKFPNLPLLKCGAREVWVSFLTHKIQDFVPIARIIEYKTKPSLHPCDARCQNAKGRQCECECKGKNHGKSNLSHKH